MVKCIGKCIQVVMCTELISVENCKGVLENVLSFIRYTRTVTTVYTFMCRHTLSSYFTFATFTFTDLLTFFNT